eukprot:m.1087683 g.1087683  ORF g.1087683 m.1087683 type:complete len:1054 (-) comp24284_c0_seq16:8735-11896(-)
MMWQRMLNCRIAAVRLHASVSQGNTLRGIKCSHNFNSFNGHSNRIRSKIVSHGSNHGSKNKYAGTGTAAIFASTAAMLQVQDDSITTDDGKLFPTGTERTGSADVSDSISDRPPQSDQDWKSVIDRATPAIVSIVINVPRNFDNDSAGSSQATGFVVDAENGIILTNKHVVHDGPIVARAIFQNHEEVDVVPVYRDPVHDFGFLKFDPAKLKHQKVTALSLRPEQAVVGADIRVLGNNAGERFSINSGTLARIDRPAPHTGIMSDFNTFYIQAASGTSGGSSGSPVIDSTGSAVALNAAGRLLTNVSLFLPLDRVTRALEYVRNGDEVPRGTVQTVFHFHYFNELRRLGLTDDEETALRQQTPGTQGMLTVKEVVPAGPGHQCLVPGDIILKVNDQVVTTFSDLEEVLDSSVGKVVQCRLARGHQRLTVSLPVQDLYSITPCGFLEAGDSIFNDMSYQTARYYNLSVSGAFVAKSGYMLRNAGIPQGAVITHVGATAVSNTDELGKAFQDVPDGQPIPVRFFHVKAPRSVSTALVELDRQWYPLLYAERDAQSQWTVEEAPPPRTQAIRASNNHMPSAPPVVAADTTLKSKIASSLVSVRCSLPYEHMPIGSYFAGTGVVVDANLGLVLCDRLTVPSAMSDVKLNFSDRVEVPAKVRFVHPVHNVAVVQYKPEDIGDVPVSSCEFNTAVPNTGDKAILSGVSGTPRLGMEIKFWNVAVGYEARTASHGSLTTNMDALTLSGISSKVQDGVIVDEDGKVRGLYASFGQRPMSRTSNAREQVFLGIPAAILQDVLEPFQHGRAPEYRCLGARLEYMGLSQLQGVVGLDTGTLHTLAQGNGGARGRRQGVVVSQRWARTPAASLLQDGDVLVSIDGTPITSVRDVDVALRGKERVAIELFRDGKVVKFPMDTFDGTMGKSVQTTRAVLWAGCVLHQAPALFKWLWDVGHKGVYIANTAAGSPSKHYSLSAGTVIVEVDGQPTPDLDAFLNVVGRKRHGETVRVQTVSVRGKESVHTITLDKQYWPTSEVFLNDDGTWNRHTRDQVLNNSRKHFAEC